MARENRGVDPDTGWVKAGTTIALPTIDLSQKGYGPSPVSPQLSESDESVFKSVVVAKPVPPAPVSAPAARVLVSPLPVSTKPAPRLLEFKNGNLAEAEPSADEIATSPSPYALNWGGVRLAVFPYSSTLASEGRAGGRGSAFLASQTNLGLEAGVDVNAASGFGFSGTLGFSREKYVVPSGAEMRVVQENAMSWQAMARTSRVWKSTLGLGIVGKDMFVVGSPQKGTAVLLPLHANGSSAEVIFSAYSSPWMRASLTTSVAYFPRQRVSLGLIHSGVEGRVGLDVIVLTRLAPIGLGLFYEETRLVRELSFDRRRAAGLRFVGGIPVF
jgi:hypothetical protein